MKKASKIFTILAVFLATWIVDAEAWACDSVNVFTHEMLMSDDIEFCQLYLTAEISYEDYGDDRFRVMLYDDKIKKWDSAQGFKARDVYTLPERFEELSGFDFLTRRKLFYGSSTFGSDLCGYSARLYRGLSEKDDKRICHIAYDPSVMVFKKFEPPKLDYSEYTKLSSTKEKVRGEFGDTEIHMTHYCHSSGQHQLYTFWVTPPEIEIDEDKAEYQRLQLVKAMSRPVQHIRLESSRCEP